MPGRYSDTSAISHKPTLRQTASILSRALLAGLNSSQNSQSASGANSPNSQLDPVYDSPHKPALADGTTAPCASIRTVWIGHASTYTLFPTRDPSRPIGVLTDPVSSRSCSPIGWPRRRVDVPFDVDGLGPVDAVIISHNHCEYQHVAGAHTSRRSSR
jgi:hypothetical protein